MTEDFLEAVTFRLGFGGWVRCRDAEEGGGRDIRKRYHWQHVCFLG